MHLFVYGVDGGIVYKIESSSLGFDMKQNPVFCMLVTDMVKIHHKHT